VTGVGTARLDPSTTPGVAELIALAQRFGRDPEFSRGGGGNASVKADGVLGIKPSGVPLATLEAPDLVPLDLAQLLDQLDAPVPDDEHGEDPVVRAAERARLAPAGGRRPSVELLFHALLPERFVLHTHPILINAVTCSRAGEALARSLFGDDVVWVPYTDPGVPLAHAIRRARLEHVARTGGAAPRVTLMQNHGLIVAADDPAEIDAASGRLVEAVESAIRAAGGDPGPWVGEPAAHAAATSPAKDRQDPATTAALVAALAPALRARLSPGPRRVLTWDATPRAAAFTATPGGRAFLDGGPLTPDHIVYAGSRALVLDLDGTAADDAPAAAARAVDRHAAEGHAPPTIVTVPGRGLFAIGDTWAEADTARHVALDALRVGEAALRLGGVRHLADPERRFIEDWEAEAYRRQVAAGEGVPGRVAGRIALVTGAAQGFGLAIAEDLVAQGAHVVLADLNVPLAEANAVALAERFGPGRAVAVPMDVTDGASVEAGIAATVERFGGLDLLVSNAGVLRAGAVTGQRVEDFDLVTRVNYRGYFLVVKHAAPVMARQHAANPGWLSDIVEINSKSGLVGSSRNSAYAGSKFGGIGLTQSFALELVGDGIKVNAICPGNFLDGPLWSDPENGLFVQYLREGKVPGATTVADVRHAYEAKVPMGRGCTPADVLEALYYLVAQQYETGQALPVTGGQVMLS
jgi:rhamnose utilization protein RhaD (predicted bifunctional aldolase and dehydrogenase)/NAD(P)-dependent dehydrogenase (short-subunit alcohol dehydrogenase family)